MVCQIDFVFFLWDRVWLWPRWASESLFSYLSLECWDYRTVPWCLTLSGSCKHWGKIQCARRIDCVQGVNCNFSKCAEDCEWEVTFWEILEWMRSWATQLSRANLLGTGWSIKPQAGVYLAVRRWWAVGLRGRWGHCEDLGFYSHQIRTIEKGLGRWLAFQKSTSYFCRGLGFSSNTHMATHNSL